MSGDGAARLLVRCLVEGPMLASGEEMGSGGCGKAASSHVRREMVAVGEVVMSIGIPRQEKYLG